MISARTGARAAILATVAGTLAACGQTGGNVVLVEGVTVEVDAVDNAFEPEALEVAAGTEIEFVNQGRNEHDVVPVDDDQDAIRVDIQDLEPGATARRTLTEPGTYAYYCTIHGTPTAGMIGTITVTEGDQ